MKWFKWRNTKWGAYTFAACAAVLLLVILEHLGVIGKALGTFIGFFTPVIYGAVIAYVMDFFVTLLERKVFFKMKSKKKARTVSVIVDTVFVIVLFVLLVIAVIPQVISSITGFFSNWDSYVHALTKLISGFGSSTTGTKMKVDTADINHFINQTADKIGAYVTKNSDNIFKQVTGIGTTIATWVISFIIAIYFLLAKKELLGGIRKLFGIIMPEKTYSKSGSAFQRINGIFSKYIVCEIVDAAIIGCANAVFMAIARMPYIALISVVVGVTNLAPTFGPIVGGVVGAFILLLAYPKGVIPFIIFTIILQTIDGYVIKPKMYGGALSVPSVWILVAIIVLGRMFGVVGILLAIPVAAIITYWIRDFIANHDRKEKQKKPESDSMSKAEETTR